MSLSLNLEWVMYPFLAMATYRFSLSGNRPSDSDSNIYCYLLLSGNEALGKIRQHYGNSFKSLFCGYSLASLYAVTSVRGSRVPQLGCRLLYLYPCNTAARPVVVLDIPYFLQIWHPANNDTLPFLGP